MWWRTCFLFSSLIIWIFFPLVEENMFEMLTPASLCWEACLSREAIRKGGPVVTCYTSGPQVYLGRRITYRTHPQTIWFSGSGWGLRIFIFNEFPEDAVPANQSNILRITTCRVLAKTLRWRLVANLEEHPGCCVYIPSRITYSYVLRIGCPQHSHSHFWALASSCLIRIPFFLCLSSFLPASHAHLRPSPMHNHYSNYSHFSPLFFLNASGFCSLRQILTILWLIHGASSLHVHCKYFVQDPLTNVMILWCIFTSCEALHSY